MNRVKIPNPWNVPRQPCVSMRCCNIGGHTAPATYVPLITIPTARPRRAVNQWEMSEATGAKVAAIPNSPHRTPSETLNCHSSVARAAKSRPAGRQRLASSAGAMMPNRSESRPIMTPPRAKPIMNRVYGMEPAPRPVPNSTAAGSRTRIAAYIAEPATAMSRSDAKSRTTG